MVLLEPEGGLGLHVPWLLQRVRRRLLQERHRLLLMLMRMRMVGRGGDQGRRLEIWWRWLRGWW